jgi:hypothetical protein
MKTLIEKLQSRKLLTTLGAYALGAYMIRSGNVPEGIALITGAQASYNIGQGVADAQAATKARLVEGLAEQIANANR